MLNVNLVEHDDGKNCTEESLVTIISFLKKEYMLMYKDAWHFNYVSSKKTQRGEKVGSCLKFDERVGCNFEYLSRYHGVEFSYFKNSDEFDMKNRVIYELGNSKPVSCDIDGFYCPWIIEFQNKQIDHGIVISGVDLSQKIFICTDSFYQQSEVTLPFEYFDKGCLGIYTYKLTQIQEHKYEPIIRDILLNYDKYDSLGALIMFREDFDNNFDFLKEIEGDTRYETSQFYINFDRYRKSRKKVSKLFEFISSKVDIEVMGELSQEMLSIYLSWDIFHKYMLKVYLSQRFNGAKERIMKYLDEIILKEECFRGRLANLVKNY